jgi:hypothetical protein
MDGYLQVLDVPFAEDNTMFDRHLICPKCKSRNVLSRMKKKGG